MPFEPGTYSRCTLSRCCQSQLWPVVDVSEQLPIMARQDHRGLGGAQRFGELVDERDRTSIPGKRPVLDIRPRNLQADVGGRAINCAVFLSVLGQRSDVRCRRLAPHRGAESDSSEESDSEQKSEQDDAEPPHMSDPASYQRADGHDRDADQNGAKDCQAD